MLVLGLAELFYLSNTNSVQSNQVVDLEMGGEVKHFEFIFQPRISHSGTTVHRRVGVLMCSESPSSVVGTPHDIKLVIFLVPDTMLEVPRSVGMAIKFVITFAF